MTDEQKTTNVAVTPDWVPVSGYFPWAVSLKDGRAGKYLSPKGYAPLVELAAITREVLLKTFATKLTPALLKKIDAADPPFRPRKKRAISQAEVDQILRWDDAGVTQQEMATRLDRNAGSIAYALRRGFHAPPKKSTHSGPRLPTHRSAEIGRVTDEERREVRRLKVMGLSCSEAAAVMGRTASVIRYHYYESSKVGRSDPCEDRRCHPKHDAMIAAIKAGEAPRDIAARLKITYSTVTAARLTLRKRGELS
jgi:hypothetical protein